MSTVTVTFYGVCTHINNVWMQPPANALAPSDTAPGYCSRVINVNGRFGSRLGGHQIPPHTSVLYIPGECIRKMPDKVPGLVPDDDRIYWSMEGVELFVANAQPGLTRTRGFDRIPRLGDVAGHDNLLLDERVVLDGRAAGVFGIYAGVLDAYRVPWANDAIVGQLTVTTDEPELVVTQVWNGSETSISLTDDAYVFVLNIGDETDRDVDFLLHYFVTTWTPPHGVVPVPPPRPDLRTPSERDGLKFLERLPAGLTLGCSNSNYP
ncbi:MAG TPA: hypothetical protein VJ901_20870 [Thermoanaerobaculia bacterium]|nr:hypothetical protein [Thermoanaerobaculia bacterium]